MKINIAESIDALASVVLEQEITTQEDGSIPKEYPDQVLMDAMVVFMHTLTNKAYYHKLKKEVKPNDRKRQIQDF
jgi:hypothetical protein